MTVTYSLEVSTSGVLTFLKILFRWRGSVYKAIWKELLGFLVLYNILKLVYLFGLSPADRKVFESVARCCDRVSDFIPLSFILGFYVTMVYNRWWSQFQAIAWPDTACLYAACYLHGTDDRSRVYRRTIARYLNLSFILGLRSCSSAVKKRLPSMEHLIEAGMMTEAELKAYEACPTRYPKQWLPCQWALNLCVRARRENKIGSEAELVELIKAIDRFRRNVRDTCFFDWMSIPLIYTQVVTLAVYSFFGACLLGRQHFGEYEEHNYFPVFTTLQFLFYVGWLKVAQCMTNPYGEDDDDFEVNFIIDRNIQTGYVFADDNYDVVPPLGYDAFWDATPTAHIPHTAASYGVKSEEFDGSATGMKIPEKLSEVIIEDNSSAEANDSTFADDSAPFIYEETNNDWRSLRRKISNIIGLLHSSNDYADDVSPSRMSTRGKTSIARGSQDQICRSPVGNAAGDRVGSRADVAAAIARKASSNTSGRKQRKGLPLLRSQTFLRTRPVRSRRDRRLSRHDSIGSPTLDRKPPPRFSNAFFSVQDLQHYLQATAPAPLSRKPAQGIGRNVGAYSLEADSPGMRLRPDKIDENVSESNESINGANGPGGARRKTTII